MKTKSIVMIMVCLMAGAFPLGATGVTQLVNTSIGEGSGISEDKLTGVLVTREYLDLFDDEAYFNDNIDKLVSEKEISGAEDKKYQGKLYACLADGEYSFDGVDGISYFVSLSMDDDAHHWTVSGDNAVTDCSTHFNSTDSGEGIVLEGTIYVSPNENEEVFYVNPVYQTPGGDVYAVSGNGIMFSSDNAPGMSSSQELKESTAIRTGDEEKTYDAAVKITVCFMEEPTAVSVLQFNKENAMISSAEYEPGKLPERMDTLPEAEYMIIETVLRSFDGAMDRKREIYQSDDEYFSTFCTREDGICIRQDCGINWGNNQEIS